MSVSTVTSDFRFSPGGSWQLAQQERAADVRERARFRAQVATIREMLSMLETFTTAGQRHTMGKIANFVGEHAERAVHRMGARNGSALAALNAGLHHESERALPDVATFSRRAEDMLTLLLSVV